ncbi:hypothetical protein G7Y89_g11327 [Cudoniella acicularis]|uniref:F-box domain-containing protein n=1 Tax=Cudoniella acicularis TaxID=354080 RepID=A0A8H4RDQ0_9HELO|nr:hypothetical protein G7Y89_g11327 [Cudoniella acicularis]
MATTAPRKQSLKERISTALRPKSSGKRLVRKSLDYSDLDAEGKLSRATSAGSSASKQTRRSTVDNTPKVDIQTGERRDNTELLHSLAHQGSFDSIPDFVEPRWRNHDAKLGNEIFANLPDGIWERVLMFMSPADAACLALTSRPLRDRIGVDIWHTLNLPENRDHKINFLVLLDSYFPGHLFCYPCAVYHLRTQKGQEKLKPTIVLNPLFKCPWANEPLPLPLKLRIAPGHTLPFAFVQLVLRARHNSPSYGLPIHSLARRWKSRESEWSHQTSYYYHKGHLLLRVISKSFAMPNLPPSGLRHLLYSREDYFPYFSACAHWRDGELMNLCKCALSHIPKPKESIAQQLQKGPQIQLGLRNVNPIVTLCSNCRPMRRCPECPTEYLIEIKFEEDRTDPNNRFKQAIVVTRWSDLGDGTTPMSAEWAACNGFAEYDSFGKLGRRGISGVFESQNGVALPGQRMLSLNPRNEKLGEEGHNWY